MASIATHSSIYLNRYFFSSNKSLLLIPIRYQYASIARMYPSQTPGLAPSRSVLTLRACRGSARAPWPFSSYTRSPRRIDPNVTDHGEDCCYGSDQLGVLSDRFNAATFDLSLVSLDHRLPRRTKPEIRLRQHLL
jgi:hypothetical protein